MRLRIFIRIRVRQSVGLSARRPVCQFVRRSRFIFKRRKSWFLKVERFQMTSNNNKTITTKTKQQQHQCTTSTTTPTKTTTMTTTIHEWRLSSGVSQIPKVTLIEMVTESYMLAPRRSLIRLPACSGPLTHLLACSLHTLICSPALSTPLTHLLAPHRLLMTMVIWDQFFFQSIQFNQCQFN